MIKISKHIKTYQLRLNDTKTWEKRIGTSDTLITKYYSFQAIGVKLQAIKTYGKIVEGLLKTGISKINGIDFSTSKADSLTREARLIAIRNARQKANELVKELGQKVGTAYAISEGTTPMYSSDFLIRGSRPVESQIRIDGLNVTDQFAEGEVEITQYVTVSFYLK